jgi:hypothetical protein
MTESDDHARDLLKRHAIAHNPEHDGTRPKKSADAPARRKTQACLACAESKLRCEGNFPCARCTHKGIACEYGRPRLRASTNSARRQHQPPKSPAENSSQFSSLSVATLEQLAQYQSSHAPSTPFRQQADSDMIMLDAIAPDHWPDTVPTRPDLPLDAAQLPTPATFTQAKEGLEAPFLSPDHSTTVIAPGSLSQGYVSSGAFDELPLAEFLRHVMTPYPHDGDRQLEVDTFQAYSRDVLDFNADQPFDVDLNCFVPSFTMPNQPAQAQAVLFDGDEPVPAKGGYNTPGSLIRGSVSVGQQAFKDSIWLWTPGLGDQAGTEDANLSLSIDDSLLSNEGSDATIFEGQMTLSARDRILSMVLNTCNASSAALVVACFPSPELLTKLFNRAFSHHLRGELLWIHPAVFNLNAEPSEFLTGMVALGAATCPMPSIRKLGFALYEALRLAMPLKVCLLFHTITRDSS